MANQRPSRPCVTLGTKIAAAADPTGTPAAILADDQTPPRLDSFAALAPTLAL
jgi:hypothetical protein